MLTQLIQCARARPEFGMLRRLRLAAQHATFSSIGLDFPVS